MLIRIVPGTVKRIIWRVICSCALRRRYKDAWLLMDRAECANDNAEHLFRYLRKERPDINAWFVVKRNTFDWQRLARDGYADRMIAWASPQWMMLLANSTHVLSSHGLGGIDPWGRRGWPGHKIVYLRHGTSQGDQSWHFNRNAIDLAIVSTLQEYESIVTGGYPYDLTRLRVSLTGLPRHDRLRELAASVRPERSEVILVAPTWRKACRILDSAELLQTEYAKAWLGLLTSPELKQFADKHGLRIVFLPHPTAVRLLSAVLPPHMSSVVYDSCDVQKLLTRAAALVTDYSSVNFDAAYIERPVVYFQFDRGEFLGGGHTWCQGYFDYFRDGFGPVCRSLQEVVEAVVQLAERRFVMPEKYRDRVHRTFQRRDGQCCARVTAAVEALS